MLRCLAIDDEPLALELLEDNIAQVPYLELVAASSDPEEALSLLRQQSVDLVFVDIQMPGLTGLQLIRSLEKRPMFILITAYEKYALEGFNLDVVDYLVKPVPLDRFIKACDKARELYELRNGGEKKPDHFFIHADYAQQKIVFDDIIWIEGLKDYVRIHLNGNSKPVVARMSMKGLEEQLPGDQFVRIHKSYIVSKKYITSVKKSSVQLNGQELPVGESYKDAVEKITGT